MAIKMRLEAFKISKRYFRLTKDANYFYAVQEMDFILPEHSFSVLLGRSGSGKTTLLNMLAGLLKPSSGQVLVDNTNLYEMDDKALSQFRNQNIGVIPQGQTALANLTVLENITLPRRLYAPQDKKNQADKIADREGRELLARFDIEQLANARPAELSGGELRRMAIARALIQKPSILLADEATSDLDDENTRIILQTFRKIADEGAAVLLVTHETEAVEYADQAFRMDAGKLNPI